MSKEKDAFSNHEQSFDQEGLREIANERYKELANEREKTIEKKENIDNVRNEALEQATSKEKPHKIDNSRETSPRKKLGPVSKRERNASFNATMDEVRSHMSAPSRAFSKVIHNPTVEKISDVVGSVFAFLFTLVIYLIARYYGYALSGGETIASFAAGWILGLVFDYFRALIFGKSK